jgi:Zn-dependent protease
MLLVAGFGWAKPVPVNPYALGKRTPAGMMWVSIAGPLSNLLLAIVAAIPLRFDLIPRAATTSNIIPNPYDFMWEFLIINLALALFNLIPIAPLDGEKIADYFFPPPFARVMDTIRPYGPLILLGMVFILPRLGVDVFGWIMGPPMRSLLHLLVGV